MEMAERDRKPGTMNMDMLKTEGLEHYHDVIERLERGAPSCRGPENPTKGKVIKRVFWEAPKELLQNLIYGIYPWAYAKNSCAIHRKARKPGIYRRKATPGNHSGVCIFNAKSQRGTYRNIAGL